jgi:TPR repeat protein
MFAYFCVSEVGGLPQDFEAAAPAYAKACRANSRDACFRLGWIHTRRDRPHEARTAFQRACKLGEERACTATQPLRPLPAQPPGPF